MHKQKGFTLVELSVIAGIIALLAALTLYSFHRTFQKATTTEAVINVNKIREAEKLHKIETGKFVSANNAAEINAGLDLKINPKFYEYRVVEISEDDFLVIAKRIGEDIENGAISSSAQLIVMNSSGEFKNGIENKYINAPLTGTAGTSPPYNDTEAGNSDGTTGTTGTSGGTSGTSTTGGGSGGGGSGGGGGGGGGGGSSGDSGSSTTDTQRITEALSLLQSSTNGAEAYTLIQEKSISIIFDDFSKYGITNAAAFWWGISNNKIYINQDQRSAPTAAIAALIAHEATHADYSYNPQTWITFTLQQHPELTQEDIHIDVTPFDSIDQEYQAFTKQVNSWNELKGTSSDMNNDGWAAIFAQGEDYMKTQLRSSYASQSLPEY